MRASIELFEEKYPGRGREAFGLIAVLSGAGSLGSAGIGDQTGVGIDLTGYAENEGISAENRAKITQILDGHAFDDEEQAEGSVVADPDADATALAKRFNKDELSGFAQQAGLDGDSFTNKTELAKAILASGFEIPEKAGDQ